MCCILYLSYEVQYISSTQYIFSFILPYQVLYYLDDIDQMHLHSLRIHCLLQKKSVQKPHPLVGHCLYSRSC